MPSFIQKGDKQMTTEEANTIRLVTKVRWLVESANARIQNWKYLQHVLPTNQTPYIGDYVSIVCSISNKYFPPLSQPYTSDDIVLASKMLYLSRQVNHLKNRVESEHLHLRSAKWEVIDLNSVPDFPKLDLDQLRNLTCGTYQLKLSSSYIQEHLEGYCTLHIHKEDDRLLPVWLQSRHTSSKTYILWIKYN